jgi:hypothetical protein
MNLKRIAIRPSAGDGVPPTDLEQKFKIFCTRLAAALPTAAPASGVAKLDLIQLHGAVHFKVMVVNDNAFTVALEQPWQHEVDELHPDHWIKTWPIALMFAVTFDVGGTAKKRYFSISFGEDLVVPDP